jgi:hypothetical protein
MWKGQLNYHKQQGKQALPPNCQNTAYMVAIGVCKPDNLCPRIKNPAQYSKRKAWLIANDAKGKKKPAEKSPKPKQKGASSEESKHSQG